MIAEGTSIYKAYLVTKVPCETLQEHLPQDAISSSTPGRKGIKGIIFVGVIPKEGLAGKRPAKPSFRLALT